MNKIAAQICEKMKGCDWQVRLDTIDSEVKAKISQMKPPRNQVHVLDNVMQLRGGLDRYAKRGRDV